VSLPVAVAWTALAGVAVVAGLAPAPWVVTGLAATGGYLLVVGAVQQAVAGGSAARGAVA
jgi:hypothetical protein